MARARARSGSGNYWPGFVDALTTLLLVIIFLLVVFVLAQVILSQAISGKDAALERLDQQVRELADLLDLERKANAELRLNAAQMSNALQNSARARDELALLLDQMTARARLLEERAVSAERTLSDAEAKIAVNRDTVEIRLRQLESLRRDIEILRRVRADFEAQIVALHHALEESRTTSDRLEKSLTENRLVVVELDKKSAALALDLEERRKQAGALRDRSKSLEARLADEQERTLLAQKEIEEKDVRLAELLARQAESETTLDEERKLSAERQSQIAILNLQIIRLREELQHLSALLDVAEEKDKESQAVIKDLGRRLNRALAAKVEELSRYRSEFFGRLKEILGDRRDIEVVGDRFVFQSEVLFESGSDELGAGGQQQMRHLAQALTEIAAEIPPEINWILRVDGHTDVQRINTPQFPSNWELSTARAISVVRFLILNGVPPDRLAATGFGAFQPIDPRRDEIGFRRNRRIELKLTQR